MLKFFLTTLAILKFTAYSFSQVDLPKIVKPSPTASELFKYQDYPVDYSTGLAQISIPIYEVTSGSLSVPISLSYHAAGRKVYDQDGPIALGWSLNAGGMISRVIHGLPDFGAYIFPNPFNTASITNYNNLPYLQRIMRYQNSDCGTLFPFYDTEYDVFSYSVGGNSGKFIFKDVANVKTPVLLPYKPFIITPVNPAPNAITFDIADDKGVIYKFGASDFTQLDEYATTGWNLEKIISADKTDTISFIYIGGVETRRTISQIISYKDSWNYGGNPANPDDPNPSFIENTSQANYQVSRISEIIFKQGKVKFNLVAGTLRIDNIQVLNLNSEVLKTIQFKRSNCYFQAEINNLTNKLDTIEFRDKLNNSIEKYAFEYYPLINSDVNGPINVRYCDWWGYYNNSGQHDMLPQYTVPSIGFQTVAQIGNPNASRHPSLEPAKSGVLKRITYPTGGNTEFIYQLNKCKITGGNGSTVDGPGLRVYQMKSTDANGTSQVRTFRYGNNESDYGFLELLPDVSTVSYEIWVRHFDNFFCNPPCTEGVGYHRERYFSSGIYEELSELADRPVMYQEVTEYKGTEASNAGKTVYKYDYSPWAASGMFPKKHIYSYNYWNSPSMISQMDYKRNRNTYQKIKSSRSDYTTTISENIKGLHVQRAWSLPQGGYAWGFHPGTGIFQNLCSEQYGVYEQSLPVYSFSDYQAQAGFKNLTQTIDTLFTDAGNLITSTSYSYNSKNLLSSTTTTTSKAETLLKNTKYPFDYTGNSTLTQMVSLNMISYPVEQIETKAATATKSVRTNYFNWGTSPARIAPQTVDVKVGSGNYETRLRYSAYDIYGNPLTVAKENDQLISYVWGYNNSYPIAEVTNTAVKNVFHTSFEDANGNSTLNDCKTGRRSRTGGYSKPLTGLDNGTYILSYWQKSGAIWTLQSSSVSVTTGSYTISLTGQVDEVRFYPKASQMKTYTYDPLIGTITECDVSDHIIYYEYDNYGRVKLIRDMNGNILKTFKYQYQGTTAN